VLSILLETVYTAVELTSKKHDGKSVTEQTCQKYKKACPWLEIVDIFLSLYHGQFQGLKILRNISLLKFMMIVYSSIESIQVCSVNGSKSAIILRYAFLLLISLYMKNGITLFFKING